MIESCMPLVWTMRVIHLLPAGLRSGTCWGDGRVSAVMGFVGDVSELISFGCVSEVDAFVEHGTKWLVEGTYPRRDGCLVIHDPSLLDVVQQPRLSGSRQSGSLTALPLH